MTTLLAVGLFSVLLECRAQDLPFQYQGSDGPGTFVAPLYDRNGYRVVGGRDLSGDGFPDYASSSPTNEAHQNVGSITAFSGEDGTLLFKVSVKDGTLKKTDFGQGLAMVPDLNDDGKADLIIGSQSETIFQGQLTFVSGATGQIFHEKEEPGIPYISWTGPETAYTSYGLEAISSIGDVNGDGKPDIAVGATRITYGPEPTYNGKVYIYSGQGPSYPLLCELDGLFPDSYFGASITELDDLDGDGQTEFIVGGPQIFYITSTHGPTGPGYTRIYSSATACTGSSIVDHGGGTIGDGFGHVTANLGDLNGDGFDEYAISAPSANSFNGLVYIHNGKTHGLWKTFDPFDASIGGSTQFADAAFGASVLSVPPGRIFDYNHDQTPDILIGTPGFDSFYSSTGAINIFKGTSGAPLTFPSYKLEGSTFLQEVTPPLLEFDAISNDQFGNQLAYLDEAQLIIGSPYDSEGDPSLDDAKDIGSTLVMSFRHHDFIGKTQNISLGKVYDPDTQDWDMKIQAGDQYKDHAYQILLTDAGTYPGTRVAPGKFLPLNHSALYKTSELYSNTRWFENTAGILDLNGEATAKIRFTNYFVSSVAVGSTVAPGVKWHAAYYLVDPSGQIVYVSKPIAVLMVD